MTIFNADYWQNRYENEATAWDIGYASPPLCAYIDQLENKNLDILIPGAGYGHEAVYLYRQGFKNVRVLDFSKKALNILCEKHPELPKNWLLQADFFNHEGGYDLILEQTFFCAIDPALRGSYAKKMYDLLRPGAKLSGVFFDFERERKEPPFGGSQTEYLQLFKPYFYIHKLAACYNSIKPRAGKELFFIFERK